VRYRDLVVRREVAAVEAEPASISARARRDKSRYATSTIRGTADGELERESERRRETARVCVAVNSECASFFPSGVTIARMSKVDAE